MICLKKEIYPTECAVADRTMQDQPIHGRQTFDVIVLMMARGVF